MKKTNVKKRVWEVDALRGFVMIGLLLNHIVECAEHLCMKTSSALDADIGNMVIQNNCFFVWNPEQRIWEGTVLTEFIRWISNPGVCCFFIISGISYKFSRNNVRGGIRLLCGAAFVSAFTKLLAIYTGDEIQFIRFGALHCYACCHFIYYFLLEERDNKTLLLVAAVSLIVGYYLKFNHVFSDSALLVPFGIREDGSLLRDYWPVFPMLGWFLIGVVLGRKYYGERVSLFSTQESQKWHKPLQFLGRHSGLIYCGHMVVYTILFYAIGQIFNLY